MTTILDALSEISGQGKLEGKGCSVFSDKRKGRNGPRLWLSGLPYLWSASSERAFVFPSREVAGRFIMRFSDQLAGADIHAWE